VRWRRKSRGFPYRFPRGKRSAKRAFCAPSGATGHSHHPGLGKRGVHRGVGQNRQETLGTLRSPRAQEHRHLDIRAHLRRADGVMRRGTSGLRTISASTVCPVASRNAAAITGTTAFTATGASNRTVMRDFPSRQSPLSLARRMPCCTRKPISGLRMPPRGVDVAPVRPPSVPQTHTQQEGPRQWLSNFPIFPMPTTRSPISA
jgi:hypothetical protein